MIVVAAICALLQGRIIRVGLDIRQIPIYPVGKPDSFDHKDFNYNTIRASSYVGCKIFGCFPQIGSGPQTNSLILICLNAFTRLR